MATSTPFAGDLSPFRTGFLKVALFISGAWVTVLTSELHEDGVSIKRGSSNEGGITEPSRCALSLKDPLGKWNPRNPASIYYGLIGRGTPLRVQVEMTSGVVLDRWYGEIVTIEPRWTKKGAPSARVDIEAAGVLRRLGQGSSALQSPLFRALTSIGTNLVAYWPMEDAEFAKQFSVNVGPQPLRVTKGTVTFATYTGLPASAPLPTIGGASLVGYVQSYTPASPATGQVRFMGVIPASTPNNAVLMRVYASGTLAYAEVRYGTGGSITVEGFNDSGASVGSNAYSLGVDGKKQRYSLEMTQSGANITWSFVQLEAGAATGTFGSGTFTGVTLGRVSRVDINPNNTALGSLVIGHLTVEKAITSLFSVSSLTLNGYLGERADTRFQRLCTENGLSSTVIGGASGAAELMGYQGRKDLLTLLRECEATDGGFLYEPRATTDLGYSTGEANLSKTPTTIAYVENMFMPFEPVEDDSALRNVITVQRDGGGSSTITQTTGTLGTTAVGIYDEQVTLSLADDDDAVQQAGWRLHLGICDEARWPQIGVDLADVRILANPALRDQFLGLGLGSRLDITGIPAWLPPFTVSQLIVGYTEVIKPHSYKLVFNCVPARPYRVAYYGSTRPDRYSGEGTVLAAPGITTTTQNTFTVTNPANVQWTTVDGSYVININGEEMTVTNVTGGNAFTVTRGVNGVRKTHATGSAVTLADPCYYGL